MIVGNPEFRPARFSDWHANQPEALTSLSFLLPHFGHSGEATPDGCSEPLLNYTLNCDLWVQLHPITTPWSPRKSLIFSKQHGVTANFQPLGLFSLMNKAVPHPSSPPTLSKGMGVKCSLHACSVKKVFSLFRLGPGAAVRSRKRVALEKSSEEPLS